MEVLQDKQLSLSARIIAFLLTIRSYFRYRKGIRDRLRMGMTYQQADERAWREEVRRIEDFVSRHRNAIFLSRKGL